MKNLSNPFSRQGADRLRKAECPLCGGYEIRRSIATRILHCPSCNMDITDESARQIMEAHPQPDMDRPLEQIYCALNGLSAPEKRIPFKTL